MKKSLRFSCFVALVALAACEGQRPSTVPDPAPSTTAEAKPVEPKPAEAKPVELKPAEAKPAEPKPAEPAAEPVASAKPASEARPPASGKRSPDVIAELAECKMPTPPGACSSDADCSSFDIGTGRCGGCGGSLSVGVTASKKDAYLAKAKCQRPACNKPSPSCVVFWHVADDGSRGGPSDIVTRCVKTGAGTATGKGTGTGTGTGTCLTLREHQ